MVNPAFKLMSPKHLTTCVVFNSPHSGSTYSAAFLATSTLDAQQIRSSEDAFVDELFAGAADCGAPLLAAIAPRAYLDLNRSDKELDPAIVEGATSNGNNPRIASGLGVIPRVVADGQVIQSGKIPMEQSQARLNAFYYPYHDQMHSLIGRAKSEFGQAILIDCHSMPSEALTHASAPGGYKPDVVLGDRFGASCSRHIFEKVEGIFKKAGLRVARNSPFSGGYITQSYGKPSKNEHAIQIEINRGLYMDEASIKRSGDFAAFKSELSNVVSEIADIGRREIRLAAE